ncbi:MAG TPA: DUF6438 domain-containing protein [Polyangia bacterium]|jgi:hypothetical protein
MRTLVACAVLAAATLVFADSSVPEAPRGPSVMLSLERTACYGRCPIYTVTVLRDGTVQWEGKRFVKVTGKATAKLPAATLTALADAFRGAGFFALADKYDSYDVTDHPSAITSYADGYQKKTIHHYHGDRSAPEKLSQLEARIDELVGTARWIGRDQR